MRNHSNAFVLIAALALASSAAAQDAPGNPEAGREIFRACVSCHSLEPGRHMTGPSLADVWGRTAGTIDGFKRYSGALANSGIVWDEHSLDPWLADPRGFIPGNRMTFPGLPDATQRRDLIAFLRGVSESRSTAADQPPAGMPGGMIGQADRLDLKTLDANNRIASIRFCGDTYSVTAETGEVYQFWEFNLRFKTDGGDDGPAAGQPVIVPAGMRGDRAYVVFASPAEISPFIRVEC